MALFTSLSSLESGFFLDFFFGTSELECSLAIPVKPLSVIAKTSGCMRVLEILNTLKSWVLPLPQATAMIPLPPLATAICAFRVWHFCLPE
jgi:hypothetical protein